MHSMHDVDAKPRRRCLGSELGGPGLGRLVATGQPQSQKVSKPEEAA